MRRSIRIASFALAGVALLLARQAGAAKKKTVPVPPLPNVLLLVDNSGSMEKMIDGSDPEQNVFSGTDACTLFPGNVASGAASTPNRWGTVLQAVTGTFANGYRCFKMDRNGGPTTQFPLEYQINAKMPYDYGYYLPYHRPVSQDAAGHECVIAPFLLPEQGGSLSQGVGGTSGSVGFSSPRSDTTTGHLPQDLATNALGLFEVSALAASTTSTVSKNSLQPPVNCTSFLQAPDGAVDAARDLIRFGLMTFDQDTSPKVGVQTPSVTYGPAAVNPFTGMWSYFQGWDGASGWPTPGSATGHPANCNCLLPGQCDYEVGARNSAAPMWEGRHVRFPDGSAPIVTQEATNDALQQILLATRPYGATPIEGMFSDARDYFWYDPSGPFGSDPYSSANNGTGVIGCRDQFIILVTDGAPNLDLRKSCEQAGTPTGQCPFGSSTIKLPDIVRDMATGGGVTGVARPVVQTYVIGFAVSTNAVGTGVGSFANCQALFSGITGTLPSPLTPPAICNGPQNTPGSPVEACCTIQEIAANGGTGGGAFFADTAGDLGRAFATILGQIATSESSRTVPIQSPTLNTSNNTFAVGSSYASTFEPVQPGTQKPWPFAGDIKRTRTICTPAPAHADTFDPNKDDDFRANVDRTGAPTRNFITVQDLGSPIDSTQTMRPFMSTDLDGGGTRHGQEVGATYANIKSVVTAPYLNLTASSCPKMTDLSGNKFGALSAADCAKASLAFAMGQAETVTASPPFNWSFVSRDPTNVYGGNVPPFGTCTSPPCASAMGAILHSTPAIAPPPSDVARDDSYRQFTTINATRPAVLYVASLDGLLHAFDVTDDQNSISATNNAGQTAPVQTSGPKNNELWAFIPPAALPLLRSNFPGGQQNLLDGSPVVKDVVFTRDRTQTLSVDKWHTALVAGFGQSTGGYYALDVTDPIVSSSHAWSAEGTTLPPTPTAAGGAPKVPPVGGTGPHFLWQLTTMPLTGPGGQVQLFGKHSATPAITTVAYDPGGGLREVGVAILPGGVDDGPFQGTCPRRVTYSGHGPNNALPFDDQWVPRPLVRNWTKGDCNAGTNDNVPGRSLTIVRLEDGQIIRTFGRSSGSTTRTDIPKPIVTKGLAIDADFDSPMTGTPVVYPGQVGAITTKFFVADIDGTVWKFDVSNPNPSSWKAEIYLDTFGLPVSRFPKPTTTGLSAPANNQDLANISQPVVLTPVLSLDRSGNLTMHVATGDQDVFSATTFLPGTDNDRDDRLADYNFLYSISEKLASDGKLRADVNWYLPFNDGERVTGPMAIFDAGFYFATFAPSVANACTNGEGRIWGVDFTNLKSGCGTGQQNKGCGGQGGLLSTTPTVQFIVPGDPVTGDPALQGQLVPGVTVRVNPPCASVNSVPDTFAGGMYTTLSMASAPTPQLVWQASKLNAGQTQTQASTNATNLNNPRFLSGIDSWAAIVE